MKRAGRMAVAVCLVFLTYAAVGSAAEYASMSISPGEILWRPLTASGGATLSVGGPDGLNIRKVFSAGSSAVLDIADGGGAALPDGQYTYDLVFAPPSGTVTRSNSDTAGFPETEPMVQSGTFRVTGGRFFVPSGADEAVITPQDVVHADDTIITGSLCVGFDCLTDGTESFGFDTIKLKENNTRIKFDDTSATAGFPANDWTIVANDSTSGGANYLAFEDTTGSKVPFKVTAGAPTNSLFVASNGKVGFRTSTPVLDLHMYTSDTPAVRLDQSNAGGFTAQVWDVAGNEANFFVRDVTAGSKLPFRIQPGSPTNTLTLRSGGMVGINTWSPVAALQVEGGTPPQMIAYNSAGNTRLDILRPTAADVAQLLFGSGTPGSQAVEFQMGTFNDATLQLRVVNQPGKGIAVTSAGRVGIGTTSPTHALDVCGTSGCAYNEGGTTWVNASSREYKENIEPLSSASAMHALQGLSPVTFTYKAVPGQNHVGFIAEDVPDLVAMRDRKGLSALDIVAVLTRVVQEQNRTIEELRGEVASLRGAVERIGSRP